MKSKTSFYLFLFSLFIFSSGIQAQTETVSFEEKNGPKADELLELEVEGIYEYSESSSYLVRLIEKGVSNNYGLDMIVGECEATALARTMEDVAFSRPLTYDLFNSVFSETSLKLKHIVITKLYNGTFYANLVISDGDTIIELDARPSDSINIAIKAGVPIFATRTVWMDAKEKY